MRARGLAVSPRIRLTAINLTAITATLGNRLQDTWQRDWLCPVAAVDFHPRSPLNAAVSRGT